VPVNILVFFINFWYSRNNATKSSSSPEQSGLFM
jgi:hypothetical protein